MDVPLTEEAFVRALAGAEVLFAWGLGPRHVERAQALRWLHTPLAGVDRVLNPELLASRIRVTSSRGVNAVAVAEQALGLKIGRASCRERGGSCVGDVKDDDRNRSE